MEALALFYEPINNRVFPAPGSATDARLAVPLSRAASRRAAQPFERMLLPLRQAAQQRSKLRFPSGQITRSSQSFWPRRQDDAKPRSSA